MKIQDSFRRTHSLFLLLLFPLLSAAQSDMQTDPVPLVADRIPLPVLDRDLLSRHTRYLKELSDDPEERRKYIELLYTSQQIEAAAVEQGLAQEQTLLEALRDARARILLDALVRHEIAKDDVEIAKLARERYTANRDQFKTPKKIKLAVIFISKEVDREIEAKTLMENIVAQLEEDPDNQELFHELARSYSDDKKAKEGGINKKWLIAPNDLEKRDPLMQASFALDRVGQVTEIVETEQGFAIAKLMAVTPSIPVSFEAARDDLERRIRSELYHHTKARLLRSLQAPEDLKVNDELLARKITEAYRARESVTTAVEEEEQGGPSQQEAEHPKP